MAQGIMPKDRRNRAFSALILSLGLIAGLVSTATPAAATVFAVTWDDNGATTASSGRQATYNDATTTTWAAPTTKPLRTGYAFDGWYTLASGGTRVFSPTNVRTSYRPSADPTTLYAQWIANTLTVTYNSQNGSPISNGSTTSGGSIASSPGTPTRDGYTFNGWFAASTGGSAITFPYAHGQTVNFTLYAQWEATSYAVTWDDNDSTGAHEGGSANYLAGSTVVDIPSWDPERIITRL